MALSLRGWGPDAFKRASPEFLAAARWAVFLERLMPIYQAAASRLNDPLPVDPEGKRAAYAVKEAAREFTQAWAPVLFPADDDE